MPQATDFEEAIIGAVLIEKQSFETASLIVSPEMFYNRTYELIYRTVAELNAERTPVDLLSVIERLRKNGNLEEVGGVSFVARLSQNFVSSAHLEYHCRIVKQKYLGRKLIDICFNNSKLAFEDTEDISDLLFSAGDELRALQELGVGKMNSKPLCELLKTSSEKLDERIELAKKGIQSGIATGLADLNRVTGGWQKSELIILAARPAMGKTAMALHFAKSAAKTGIPVAMFELEMSDVKLSDRLILSETNVVPENYRLGRVTKEEYTEVQKAVGKLYDYPIYVDSNTSVKMEYIYQRCRILKQQGKCEMVVIDYLQLAGEKGDKNRNREQEISQMTRQAKLIAKELDIPVILLSQLNRSVETRSDKRPMLSDLRESGAIEQDADMVIFIHRPEYYSENAEKGYGELIISKYRDGATGIIKFRYNESMTKIFDWDYRGQSLQQPAKSNVEVKNYYEPGTPF
jgi:replicative DNA helicase